VPGKRPREAVKAYLGPLQQNLSIVCKGVLRVNNYDDTDKPGVLTLESAVALNGRSDFFLGFTQQYTIIEDPENGPYRVKTTYYSYTVETEAGEEVFGYHWHPDGDSPIRFPHLHIGPAVKIGLVELNRKAHFPTGRVAFEDVVEFLINALGVKPSGRLWQKVVQKTRVLFDRHKSW